MKNFSNKHEILFEICKMYVKRTHVDTATKLSQVLDHNEIVLPQYKWKMAEGKFEVSSAYSLVSPKKGRNLDLFLSNNICQFNYSTRFSGVSNVKKTATACHTITALLTKTHAYMCCISYQYSCTCVPHARAKKCQKCTI